MTKEEVFCREGCEGTEIAFLVAVLQNDFLLIQKALQQPKEERSLENTEKAQINHMEF